MKAKATASKEPVVSGHGRSHRGASYQKVFDGRKQPIRGLWRRNDRFYARLAVRNHETGKMEVRRVPLGDEKEPVETVAQAVAALRRLQTRREDNDLPVLRRTPKFADYAASYLDYYTKVKDAKRPSTIGKERGALRLWKEHLGDVRLDRINRAMINDFIAKRQMDGIAGRTVNLDVIALRNVLKRAIDDGWLKVLPTQNMRPLKITSKKRELVAPADIAAVCETALARREDGSPVTKNGRQRADYIRLLAYSGARRNEALRLKWADVDWSHRQLTIGADGSNKNREVRVVDFNPSLEGHLKEMHGRRATDSQFLFPSPQRGDNDTPAKSFMESLKLVRSAITPTRPHLAKFGFHDCRHHFISHAVMSGIDFMTVARWVGHKDGGVLIGKVYGHLSSEHRQAQAARLNFGPVALPSVATA